MHELLIRHSPREYEAWQGLLRQAGIEPARRLDRVYGIFDGGRLVATGARGRNILKCFAIAPDFRGGAAFNEIASALIADAFRAGYGKLFVYTQKEALRAFESLGFALLEHVGDSLYFLERAADGFPAFLEALAASRSSSPPVGAIVMNANPFTLGHRYLVETAAAAVSRLHLFVLSDDVSAFPADVRKRLVIEGTKDLGNVVWHDTDDYLVSSATFPSYFIPEGDALTETQARLDARLFKNHIAPALAVDRRYVGEEPFSRATAIYNEAMAAEFAGRPELIEIPRLEIGGTAVSASEVRRLLAAGDLAGVKRLVPASTYRYLAALKRPFEAETLSRERESASEETGRREGGR